VSNNLLKNPGFEKGVKYWNTVAPPSAKTSFDIDSLAHTAGNHSARAVISTLATNPWDIQLTQTGFSLTAGKQYELKVSAKADSANRKFNISVINAQNYSGYGTMSPTLSTTWTTYTTQFSMTQNAPAILTVDLGVHTGTYYLDDFSLIDLATKTDVASGQSDALPAFIRLEQNYPNPFNPTTRISYTIGRVVAPSASEGPAVSGESGAGRGLQVAGSGSGTQSTGLSAYGLRLTVYDLLGREVAVLVDGVQSPGRHEVVFDARDLASGTYIYRLTAGGFSTSRTLVVLK
jgi:hypothetical protein